MARLGVSAWLPLDRVAASVRMEPVLVLICLALIAWGIYKIFLRKANQERHRNLQALFRNLVAHLGIGLSLFGIYELLDFTQGNDSWFDRVLPYVGFFAIIWGCVVFIKISRIMAFEYLFLGSMKAGVPLLLVNIFTLLLSLVAGAWILTSVFQVNLAPLLATSAILSIVLGLALQDTLGNLFAGIALQFDKPFELGDWIEARNGSDRVAGQVQEVSWRATVLLAVTDELITIPNRSIAQWQISNFAARNRPFIRSHIFRLPFGADVEAAKQIIAVTAESIPGVLRNPSPVVITTETTESWIQLKAVYSIVDYGLQFGIADRFLTRSIAALQEAGIDLAPSRLLIERTEA